MLSKMDTGYLMSKRILVADDSVTIQQAFAMVMDGSGYALSTARTVEEGLSVAKRDGRPDLVLADAILGNGSGYDLCAQIKAQPGMRDVPVFILASNQTPYDDVRGREVGADGHLAKPFESQALLDAVASALLPPARPLAMGVLPDLPSDVSENTTRSELAIDDDDSYGEITIERGPAPSPPAWSAKPAVRPSGSHPTVGGGQIPSGPPSPRPSLIPGARPSTSMPVSKPVMTPQPVTSAPSPSTPRPSLNRTMMGFPSAKPATPPKSATMPSPPRVPSALPPQPTARRFTPPMPIAAVSSTQITTTTPAAPSSMRSPLPPPVGPTPPPVARPIVPRLSPPPPTAGAPHVGAPSEPSDPVTRKVRTPAPPTGAPSAPGLAAMVTSAVDQKMAALAARGPEYEAIAKLSREIIEQVVWEVVPELAEAIIRQEVDRLASARK
jgi:CheY-like chemotaxis protein